MPSIFLPWLSLTSGGMTRREERCSCETKDITLNDYCAWKLIGHGHVLLDESLDTSYLNRQNLFVSRRFVVICGNPEVTFGNIYRGDNGLFVTFDICCHLPRKFSAFPVLNSSRAVNKNGQFYPFEMSLAWSVGLVRSKLLRWPILFSLQTRWKENVGHLTIRRSRFGKYLHYSGSRSHSSVLLMLKDSTK